MGHMPGIGRNGCPFFRTMSKGHPERHLSGSCEEPVVQVTSTLPICSMMPYLE